MRTTNRRVETTRCPDSNTRARYAAALARRSYALRFRKLMEPKAKKKGINVPKLDDANWAGTENSRNCTLILTEGDSAKALAVSGLEIVGRDEYGVFPLRGKILNVRDVR